MASPNYNIEVFGLSAAVRDCLIAAERVVNFQSIHKISNTEVTSIANALKASRTGWGVGGVYANTHGFISTA